MMEGCNALQESSIGIAAGMKLNLEKHFDVCLALANSLSVDRPLSRKPFTFTFHRASPRASPRGEVSLCRAAASGENIVGPVVSQKKRNVVALWRYSLSALLCSVAYPRPEGDCF
jgi:hypothetical protein